MSPRRYVSAEEAAELDKAYWAAVTADSGPIMDWGSDVAASLKYIAEHPSNASLGLSHRAAKDTATSDRMSSRTHYEQKSYEAYSRLLDSGHRA
jgi:hypothetical protein